MEFGKVVAGAFYYVGQHRKVLAKTLLIPFLLYLVIDAFTRLDIHPVAYWSLLILGVGVQSIFAITTHRVLLLGPDSVPTWGITSWTKREIFFVLHVIGLYLIVKSMTFLTYISNVGGLISLVLMFWVVGRLCLVFPGIAVDKGISFRLSFQMTENHKILMFLVAVMFPLLLYVPTVLLSFVPYTFLLASFISTFMIVFEVAALSMTYQLITDEIYDSGNDPNSSIKQAGDG